MSDEVMQQLLEELFSPLETLEAQTAAILEFLKSRDIASEEDLAPFQETAAKASNVRWRAARARISYLLSNGSRASEAASYDPSKAPGGNNDQ